MFGSLVCLFYIYVFVIIGFKLRIIFNWFCVMLVFISFWDNMVFFWDIWVNFVWCLFFNCMMLFFWVCSCCYKMFCFLFVVLVILYIMFNIGCVVFFFFCIKNVSIVIFNFILCGLLVLLVVCFIRFFSICLW